MIVKQLQLFNYCLTITIHNNNEDMIGLVVKSNKSCITLIAYHVIYDKFYTDHYQQRPINLLALFFFLFLCIFLQFNFGLFLF